jgi:hypothetical protein
MPHGGFGVKRRINLLKKKENRIVMGIETGNLPQIGAAVVEIKGQGDGTVLDLHGFKSHTLPKELFETLEVLGGGGEFDDEEVAGINFLILHHLSNLYIETIEELDIASEEVDLIGLKCIETGGETFPGDPAVFSEMTDRIVASRFGIGSKRGDGVFLPVSEPLLRGMVGDMIEKFGFDNEVHEAVAVALLANESLYHERSELCRAEKAKGASGRPSLRAMKRTGQGAGDGASILCGEFFFPA